MYRKIFQRPAPMERKRSMESRSTARKPSSTPTVTGKQEDTTIKMILGVIS